MSVFNPLGWHLNADVIDRVSRGMRELILDAIRDPAITGEGARWLCEYDATTISRYTAIDEKFQTITGRPIQNVLDFGSGVGRQALLWSFERNDVALASVDAIESLYVLQSEIYHRLLGERLREYYDAPAQFQDGAPLLTPGAVVHWPTWHLHMLPGQSFDLIICVQVLQELNKGTIQFALQQFKRLIRPCGLLYIRDNEFWTPAHRVRVGRELLRQGWHLAFRYPGNEGTDIEGIPRLWTFTGDDYSR